MVLPKCTSLQRQTCPFSFPFCLTALSSKHTVIPHSDMNDTRSSPAWAPAPSVMDHHCVCSAALLDLDQERSVASLLHQLHHVPPLFYKPQRFGDEECDVPCSGIIKLQCYFNSTLSDFFLPMQFLRKESWTSTKGAQNNAIPIGKY